MFDNLTDDNALLYATKVYDNPECLSLDEFLDDYKRVEYISRLCHRYRHTRTLNLRLFVNHVIALTNVFGVEATVRLLFLQGNERDYRVLATVLEYMDMLPETVRGIDGFDICVADIPRDAVIQDQLKGL